MQDGLDAKLKTLKTGPSGEFGSQMWPALLGWGGFFLLMCG